MRWKWMLFVLCACVSLSATVISHPYRVAAPTLTRYNDYDKLTMNGAMVLVAPGQPAVPSVPVRILLPAGEKATAATVHFGEPVILPGTYHILPAQPQQPIGCTEATTWTAPDPLIYGSDQPYPGVDTVNLRTGYYRGHSLSTVMVNPVRYFPLTGELLYYPEFTVEITSAPDPEAQNAFSQLYRADAPTRDYLLQQIDNPDELAAYPSETRDREEDHPMVIITSAEYLQDLTPLVEFKTRQGYNPLITTVDEIYAHYSGIWLQDKVRQFIKDCYMNSGTEYVILAGARGTVPYCRMDSEESISSDMYYAGMDRVGEGNGPDWDTNDNHRWGELAEADLYPDIAVGRLIAVNEGDMANIVNKQMLYPSAPVTGDIEKALLLGEQLDTVEAGSLYKEEIVGGSSHNGYTTIGIPDNFVLTRLYDSLLTWGGSDVIAQMNAGTHLINHMGHSGTVENMRIGIEDVTDENITADGVEHGFFIIYSQGCYAADLDEGCIASQLCSIHNGCCAYLGNSRSGWHEVGGTNGTSQFLDRYFFDGLFGQNISKIGEANNYSKAMIAPMCTNAFPFYLWSSYELNLIGDPSLDIWTAPPVAFNPTYQTSIVPGQTDVAIQTGVPGARVCLSQNNRHLSAGLAGDDGNITLAVGDSLAAGAITLTLTAHNYLMYTGQIAVVATDDPTGNPLSDGLQGVYPNPFNPTVAIQFSVAHAATPVRVAVYNVRGQKVCTLQDGRLNAGNHVLRWNGTDEQQRPVSSGIYFCRAEIGNKTFFRKMLLLK